MSKKYMPNNAMTDRMGYEIVQALNSVAGALSGEVRGDNAVLVCHPVGRYPGEGSDPYEGKYLSDDSSISSEAETPQNDWLDKTWGEIKAACSAGKIVLAVSQYPSFDDEVPSEDRNSYSLYRSSPIFILSSCGYPRNTGDVKMLQFEMLQSGNNEPSYFALNDSDYPCALEMQDPNHPESYEPVE